MSKRFERAFLVVFAIFAVGLGFWGYARAGSDFDQTRTFVPALAYAMLRKDGLIEGVRCLFSAIGLVRLYDLFQPGKAPWQLVFAQVLVPGIALFSAAQLFLAGVRKNVRTLMARRKSRHTIVFGIGDVGMQVVQNLRSAGQHIVAVDLQDDSAGASTCEKSGVPLVVGDAKNPHVLLAAGIRRAQTAIISAGSDSESLDIALQIKAIYAQRSYLSPGTIQVLAQVRNDWMHNRLMVSDKNCLGSAEVDLRLFNLFTDAARMLIKRLHLPPGPEFEARTFVLVGFGAYGREIALHLIRAYPVALGRALKILVFDEKADEAKERFAHTVPAASQIASLEFIQANVAPGSPDLTRVVAKKLESAEPLLGIALALGEDEVSLCAALEMRSLLDRYGHLHVPIYARLEHYRRLGDLVRDLERVSCFDDRLQIFGTLEETLSRDVLLDLKLDAFARALHEDYRLRARGAINPQADVPFRDLPEFLKMSNRWRADHTPLLMNLAGLHMVGNLASPAVLTLNNEQIDLLARLEHRRYTIERRLIENRPGSSQRDNPNLADWDSLSEDQKDWNRKEAARMPEIMAGQNVELHPVRRVRLYGNSLASASSELDQLLAAPKSAHCSLIVDLDDPDAVRVAARALSLPSLSLWLFSREEPREYSLHKPQTQPADRALLIQRANGWSLKDRLTLES